MKRLHRKLAYIYSEGGLSGVLLKILSIAARAFYSQSSWNILAYKYGELDLSEPLIQCRELKLQDLLDALYSRAAAYPEEMRRRFDRHDTCYGFYSNDRLAVVGWSMRDCLELDRGVIFPCPSDVGLIDFSTLPEFRGRGLFTDALRYVVWKFHKSGANFMYLAVDPNNTHSNKGIRSAGFSPLFCISRRRILGFTFMSRGPTKSALVARAT